MKIVHLDEVPLRSRGDGSGHAGGRGGPGHDSRDVFTAEILERDGMRPDNFTFNVSTAGPGSFMTPRHHHNFDQMRYMLDGRWTDPNGILEPGVLGIFPEGTWYGPQNNPEDQGTVLVIQFGSASGSGYIPKDLMRATAAKLKARNVGVFEDGLYKRNPGVEGPPVQDAYEAIWEEVKQRPIEYPEAQYPTPIFVDSRAFPWTPMEDADGVYEKPLGTFTSCQYRVARYKLDPGAAFVAPGRGVYFVLTGGGQLEDGPFRDQTSIYLEEGEAATFVASKESDILYFGLPRLSRMKVDTEQEAVPAE